MHKKCESRDVFCFLFVTKSHLGRWSHLPDVEQRTLTVKLMKSPFRPGLQMPCVMGPYIKVHDHNCHHDRCSSVT